MKALRRLAAFALLALSGIAQAAVVSVVPSTHVATTGSTFSVTVRIDDLVDGAAPSLGAFDLDLSYDPTVLSATSLAYGTELDLFSLGSVQFSDLASGLASVGEVSLDAEADLDALQSGAFALFTLTFQAIGTGTSGLTLGLNALADSAGASLDASLVGASVNVTPVPVPAALWLLISGLVGVAAARRRVR